MKCVTCGGSLRVKSIGQAGQLEKEQLYAKLKPEHEAGEFGYFGERQFCDMKCAAVFGRAALAFLTAREIKPQDLRDEISIRLGRRKTPSTGARP